MSDEMDAVGEALVNVLGDQDFKMNDEGEIEVDAAAIAATSTETPPVVEAEPTAQPPAAIHNWEERYQNLEPEFTRKSQRLSELEKDVLPEMQQELARLQGQVDGLTRGEQPADGTVDDGLLEIPTNFGEILMNEPERGAQMIAEIADRVAANKLLPILERVAPMLEDWELETELKTAALVEGREDFFELLPTIRDIIVKSESDLSFDDAYNLAKTFHTVDGEVPPAPAVQPEVVATERISPEDALANANRLAPDTGVSGEVQQGQRVADSVEEAFNMAVEDVLGE